MRRSLAALLTIGLLAAGAALAAAASSIKVGDNYFVRSSGVPVVHAAKGSRVTFKFTGSNTHEIVATGPSRFGSQPMSSGTFKSPKLKKGTYSIYCDIHGKSDQSMKLKVP